MRPSNGRIVVEIGHANAPGRLVISDIVRGPLARRWRLGTGLRDTGLVPVTISLAVPALTARLDGTVHMGATTVRMHHWRASLEHAWGTFMLRDSAWDGWHAVTVHGRARSAWLAFGVNRLDTEMPDRGKDGQWLGILARISRGHTRLCRPRVHRRPQPGYPATELRLRCPGRRVILPGTPDNAGIWGFCGVGGWEELGRLAARPGGAVGLMHMRGQPLPLF